MPKLDDITINFSAARKIPQTPDDFKFSQLYQYVCDLYHTHLSGYKPLKTSRIIIRLNSVTNVGHTIFFGSICTVFGVIDEDLYLANNDEQNIQYLLEIIHKPILIAAETHSWDIEVFKKSYEKIVTDSFKYRVQLPAKARKNAGEFYAIIEKDILTTHVSICISTPSFNKTLPLFTKKNISCHDSALFLCKKLKWFNSDQIGFELKEFNIKLCYTISMNKLESNLKFNHGNMYWGDGDSN